MLISKEMPYIDDICDGDMVEGARTPSGRSSRADQFPNVVRVLVGNGRLADGRTQSASNSFESQPACRQQNRSK